MRYGPIVAERYKKQYCKRGTWEEFPSWHKQPYENWLVLRELSSKSAIVALLDASWIRRLPKEKK